MIGFLRVVTRCSRHSLPLGEGDNYSIGVDMKMGNSGGERHRVYYYSSSIQIRKDFPSSSVRSKDRGNVQSQYGAQVLVRINAFTRLFLSRYEDR